MAGSDSSSTPNNNKNYVSRDGKSATFDRSMTSYLKAKLPLHYNVLDTEQTKNDKFKYFQNVGMRRPEAIAKNSIALNNQHNTTAFSAINQDNSFGDAMYAAVSEDKPGRLKDYRNMSSFSEVADALDEICDETINPDEDNDVIKLVINHSDLDGSKRDEISEEFERYAEHFNFQDNGWRYFRQLLIEGELFFEQIIHEDYLNMGVVGIVNLPADLLDPVYDNIQNMIVKAFIYRKPIFDKNDIRRLERYEYVPFEENQIVYVNNSTYNDTKDFIVPFIENCRRAYRQLSMVEDSIIINRMVHAPLRFVFNVDVGRMPGPQAESYLRKLQSQYWSTKTFDVDQNDIAKKYIPNQCWIHIGLLRDKDKMLLL